MRRLLIGMFLMTILSFSAVAAADSMADSAVAEPPTAEQIAAVRRATAKYLNVANAIADGYVSDPVCVPGMGFHHWKVPLMQDNQFDILQPEGLLYIPTPSGGRMLVGVEYFIPEALAPAIPTLFNGQSFDGPMDGHSPGMPRHYDLHVALWSYNPNGMFIQSNPAASCTPPVPSFPDVPPGHPYYAAITELAARGIIRGYENGRFGVDDTVQRAQMAALNARAAPVGPDTPPTTLEPPACLVAGTWDCEVWGNNFTDQGGIDPNLWRNIGSLQHYGVVFGYTQADCAGKGKVFPCYGPTEPVTYAQTISFITRTLVKKGAWQPQTGMAHPYSGVPPAHEDDIRTFFHYTMSIGGIPALPAGQNWNSEATRGWFAQALGQALR